MLTDRQIKTLATQKENNSVFNNFNAPRDVWAECSDGMWVRYLRTWIGGFTWDKWTKV